MTGAIAGPCDAGVAGAAAGRRTPHPRATLVATILGSSIAFIDGSVVNVSLPAIARDFNAGAAVLPWTINAYLLPLGALILLGGAAGDHLGRRMLFLFGLGVFAAASMLCAAAPTLAWLLAGRALQGLGAAVLMPNSLAILGAGFAGEARGRAIGIWAAAGALAGALGPLLGGWLVDIAGWRTIFLLNMPLAAAAAWLGLACVAESTDERSAVPLDWLGALLATLALALLTWSLTATTAGDSGPTRSWAAAASLGLFGWFVGLEAKRGDGAIMPLVMFATPTFVGLTLLTFFLYASLGGLLVLLPFLLIRIEGYSAFAAGAALLPLPIAIGLGSPLMGRLGARYGPRPLLTGGSITVAAGLALYLQIGNAGIDYWSEVLPATLTVAIGMSASVAPLTTAVMGAVDAERVGIASGFNSAVARIAGLIATALLGFVFTRQDVASAFIAGVHTAAIAGALSALLAAASATLLIRTGHEPRAGVPSRGTGGATRR
jgi:EmrB/QacA subfamily drug resistance transporter